MTSLDSQTPLEELAPKSNKVRNQRVRGEEYEFRFFLQGTDRKHFSKLFGTSALGSVLNLTSTLNEPTFHRNGEKSELQWPKRL